MDTHPAPSWRGINLIFRIKTVSRKLKVENSRKSMVGLEVGTLDWLVSIGSLACTKLPSLALAGIALIGLPLLAHAAPVTWAFYETWCAPIRFGFPCPFTPPCGQPMATFPFALMTLTRRGPTSSGTARWGAVSARRRFIPATPPGPGEVTDEQTHRSRRRDSSDR